MSEQINTVIDNLAGKLGVAVSEIYRVMTAQASAEIGKSIFSIAISLAILALCWLYVKKVFIEEDEDGDAIAECLDEDILFWISFAVFVLAVIMLFCIIFNARTIIQCAMNPEYWALKQIFNLIK